MLIIAALYHFTRFPDPAALRGPLLSLCTAQGVKGSLLLAREGINGTIAGPRAASSAATRRTRPPPLYAGAPATANRSAGHPHTGPAGRPHAPAPRAGIGSRARGRGPRRRAARMAPAAPRKAAVTVREPRRASPPAPRPPQPDRGRP